MGVEPASGTALGQNMEEEPEVEPEEENEDKRTHDASCLSVTVGDPRPAEKSGPGFTLPSKNHPSLSLSQF